MSLEPDEEIAVTTDDLAAVLAVLDELTAATSGWVNLLPEVEPGHEPPPRNLVIALFSARGDAVPLATWTAPARAGGRPTVGIGHGSGPQALAQLEEAGLGLGPGWWKAADHPRRGLVVNPPADAAPADVLRWLLDAATELSTVPLTGAWLARVYRPGGQP